MSEEAKKTNEEINEDVENKEVETETEEQEVNNNNNTTDEGAAKKERTFTQAQVNRMMTKEKNQGRNSVYKELGIDPKDSKAIAQFKAFIEAQKTDEQKAAEQQAEANSKAAENERRVVVAEAKAEAMIMGVRLQYVDDVVTLALAKMADGDDIKTVLGEMKTKYPVWFSGDSEEEKEAVGKKGTGSSVATDKSNSSNKKKEEVTGIGKRLAAQRKSSQKKSSYWGNR